jgi:hypothetical protein
LLLHKNKRPKHGGSVIGRERIWRLRIDADHKLMLNYFVVNEVYPEQFFDAGLGWHLFKHIQSVKMHDQFFEA